MVVGPASCATSCLPAADVAMLPGLRIWAIGRFCVDDAFERSAHMSVKGTVIVHAEALRLVVRPGRHHVAEFWTFSLHRLDQIGVKAKLKHGATLGLACELCIGHFVGPGPEPTRLFDATQHIRPANPTICLKCALDNDLRAVRHRGPGSRHGVSVDSYTLDYRDREAVRFEMIDEALLVPRTAFPQNLQQGVPEPGLFQSAFGNGEIQACQVAAVQVPDQVGRTEPDCSANPFHSQHYHVAGQASKHIVRGLDRHYDP